MNMRINESRLAKIRSSASTVCNQPLSTQEGRCAKEKWVNRQNWVREGKRGEGGGSAGGGDDGGGSEGGGRVGGGDAGGGDNGDRGDGRGRDGGGSAGGGEGADEGGSAESCWRRRGFFCHF